MKKALLISILSAVISLSICRSISAQNYQSVKSERTVLFEKLDGNIKSIRIDSVHIQNTDSILFPYSNIQNIGNDSECYTPYGSSWIGPYVVIQEDGYNLFFNKYSDTIKIKTNALLEDSWEAYHLEDSLSIYATITNHDTLTYLGLVDSVKTISFQAYNSEMLAIEHDINEMSLLLSKSVGFVRLLNFYFFPDFKNDLIFEETLVELDIVGLNYPEIGVQNLNWFDVHNFQIGDEIHVESFSENAVEGYSETHNTIFKYFERANYEDSIVYMVDRQKRLEIASSTSDSISINFVYDTVKIRIDRNISFDNLPDEPILDENFTIFYPKMNNNVWFRKAIENSFLYDEETTDSCYTTLIIDACYSGEYYENLGGPYYNCNIWWYTDNRELVYYKKGEEEWGTPIDFTTSISKKNKPTKILVYPNPVKDVVLIERTSQEILAYKLVDLSGKIMLAGRLTQKKETINLNTLDAGVYFLIAGEQKLKIIKK